MQHSEIFEQAKKGGEELFNIYRNNHCDLIQLDNDLTPKKSMARIQNIMYCVKTYGATPEEKYFKRQFDVPAKELIIMNLELVEAVVLYYEFEAKNIREYTYIFGNELSELEKSTKVEGSS